MADHATPVTGLSREPAAVTATITALVAALIALVVAFGLDLTKEQEVAIIGVTAVLAPIVAGLITRAKVSPASTVVAQSTAGGAVVAGPASSVPDGVGVNVTQAFTPGA